MRTILTAAVVAAAGVAALPGAASAASAAKCDVDMVRDAGSRTYQGTARCAGSFGGTTLLGGPGRAVAQLPDREALTCRPAVRRVRLQVRSPRPFSFFEPDFARMSANLVVVEGPGVMAARGSGWAEGEPVNVAGAAVGCRRMRLTVTVAPRPRINLR